MAGGYNIFTPIEGPRIDISLFGDAAQAGANLGKAIPSPFAAAIEGGVKGYQTGQEIALKNKQIEATTQENQLRGIQLDLAKTTQDVRTKATTAQLQEQLDTATKADADLTTQDQIEKKLASGDPNQVASIYSDPQSRGLLLSNPKYADSVAGAVHAMPNASDELKQQSLGTLGLSQQLKFQNDRDKVNARQDSAVFKDYDQTYKAYTGTHAATVLQDIPQDELATRVKVLPKGSFAFNEDRTVNGDVAPDYTSMQDQMNKGQSSLIVDNKYVGDVSEVEGTRVANMQRAVDAKHRTLARDAGIYYPGWRYNPPAQQPRAQAPAAAGAGEALPTFANAIDISGNKPTPTPSPNENPAIVQQSLDAFNKLANNPPTGMSRGGNVLTQRRDQVKQQLNQLIGASPASSLNSATNTQIQNNIQTQATAPTGTPASAMTVTPSAALSGVLKKNVSLNIDEPLSLPPKVRDTVNADPLLANESPLIKGMAAVESAGNRNAKSPTGVGGLLQVTKAVAQSYGLNRDIPEQNVAAGKMYMTSLLTSFKGNLPLALAAFNAGPGTIADAVRHTGSSDWSDVKAYLKDHLSAKKFKETSAYPDKVISYTAQFMGNGGGGDQGAAYLMERNGLIKAEVPAPEETQV